MEYNPISSPDISTGSGNFKAVLSGHFNVGYQYCGTKIVLACDKMNTPEFQKWKPLAEVITGLALSIFVMGTTSFFLPALSILAGVAFRWKTAPCKSENKSETNKPATRTKVVELTQDKTELNKNLKNVLVKIEEFMNNYKTELYALGLLFATFTPVAVLSIPVGIRAGYIIADKLNLFGPKEVSDLACYF